MTLQPQKGIPVKKISFLSLLIAVAAFAAPPTYKVITKIKVGGGTRWDYAYLDSANHRLYVSHGTQVEVLDVDSGSIAGKIANTFGAHGIAVAPELGRGFVSNGQAATVTIFDLNTLKTIGEVPTGKKPDAIIYDPATTRVFAFNGGSHNVTVIDAAVGNVVGNQNPRPNRRNTGISILHAIVAARGRREDSEKRYHQHRPKQGVRKHESRERVIRSSTVTHNLRTLSALSYLVAVPV